MFLFNKTLKDKENIYIETLVDRYDISYGDFKEVSRKTWEEEYKYFCINRSKKKDQGRYCICKLIKNTYIEFIPESKRFD